MRRQKNPPLRRCAPQERRFRKPAFTLLEMLLTTALAVMLLSLLLFVGIGVRRSERVLSATYAATDRHEAAWRMIEHDLTQARMIEAEEGRVMIDGYGALDAATLEPTWLPCVVTYEVAEVAGRPALVRRQSDLGGEGFTEVVAMGVGVFEVEVERPEDEEGEEGRGVEEPEVPGVRRVGPRGRPGSSTPAERAAQDRRGGRDQDRREEGDRDRRGRGGQDRRGGEEGERKRGVMEDPIGLPAAAEVVVGFGDEAEGEGVVMRRRVVLR